MNQFAVNSPLRDHMFIRMFSVWPIVHLVYCRIKQQVQYDKSIDQDILQNRIVTGKLQMS